MPDLATFDDLAAVGSINVDWKPGEPRHTRASRLLTLASSTVVVYLSRFGVTRDGIEEWDDDRRTALAAIVAEIAAKRLQLAAAPNVDPYDVPNGGPSTIKLNRWEKEALRELIPGTVVNGLGTITIDRGHYDLTGRIAGWGVTDGILWELEHNVVEGS